MKTILQRLPLNQRLAAVAALLGLVALIAGNPYGGTVSRIEAKDLALMVNNEVDHVTPDELSGWIVEGRTDFRLIDLRTEAEYAEYHIPQSENIQLAAITDAGLLHNEKIILYSEGGIHSAQAWFLLKAKGYKGVYILFGGLEEWKESVLFPALTANPTPEQSARFERKVYVAKFFGGAARTGGSAEESGQKVEMPKLAPPSPSTAPRSSGAAAKKKKDGC
jgi:rhodanese-related sulfurtransferase